MEIERAVEILDNEDGNEQRFCGQCGQAIEWDMGTKKGVR